VEGAEDEFEHAHRLVQDHEVGAKDVLIAVAASGTTPFTLACLREGKKRGALTIGIANNSGSQLLAAAEHPILLDTGPEVIAGSTRLKAGTSQKVALNLFSTQVMVRLGRVHGGLMVHMRATNEKLRHRARRMVMRLASCSEETAASAVEDCPTGPAPRTTARWQ